MLNRPLQVQLKISQQKKINADPQKWADKIRKVYDASKKYLLELKDILGSDYDAAAGIKELKPILKFAEEIEKKK